MDKYEYNIKVEKMKKAVDRKDYQTAAKVADSLVGERSTNAKVLMMIAQVCDMEVGEFVHVIADAHIYDRHVEIVKELIERPTFPAPKVLLNPEIKDFYDFTVDDIHIEDYQAGEQVKNIPVAV